MIRTIKKGFIGLLIATFLSGAIQEAIWSQYQIPTFIGDTTQINASGDIDLIETPAKIFFVNYYNQFIGWNVPYEYRIRSAELISAEMLEETFVKLDYKVTLLSHNPNVVKNHDLNLKEDGTYVGSKVLKIRNELREIWTVEEVLTVEEYETLLANESEPSISMDTVYAFAWYNKGDIIVSYKIGDEDILHDKVIFQHALEEKVVYTITDTGCYVTFATDRLSGNQYYATYWSDNMKVWERIELPEVIWRNQTSVFWKDGGYGYYACRDTGCYYVTKDNGVTFEQYVYPEPEPVVEKLGYNPFDTVEEFYEQDGVFYMRVGQGSDGDYYENGQAITAIYTSKDGEHFEFWREKKE